MRKLIFLLSVILCFIPANFSSAAVFDTVQFLGNSGIIYPLVITGKDETDGKINAEIRRTVQEFVVNANTETAEPDFSSVDVGLSFSVPCNYENGIVSILLHGYVNYKGSAHPLSFLRALNFNSDSGKRIYSSSLTEIGKEEFGESAYSPKNVTRKLKAHAAKEGFELYPEFTELESVPNDFYFDQNLHVHFIFQQYEVAPYAVGIIDVDAG